MQLLTLFVFLSYVLVCVNVFVLGHVALSPSGTGESRHVGWWEGVGIGWVREIGVVCLRVYVLRNVMIFKIRMVMLVTKTFLVNKND